MPILRDHDTSCTIFAAEWPALLEATLRGAQLDTRSCAALAHIASCPTCAATFAELLALVTWREAQTPFNADSLPLTARCQPAISQGGARGDRIAS